MKKPFQYLVALFLILVTSVVILFILFTSQADPNATYDLRGRYKPSLDGKTYLVIEDANGGQCGRLLVDNKKWLHALNTKGLVKPGIHRIECGTSIMIEVPKDTIYYFDYWGP